MRNKLLIFTVLAVSFVFSGKSLAVGSKPTIAVLRFENKSAFDRLDPFEIALPYMLISDLSKISGIQLVERDKIDKLMAETGLAGKDLMDPAAIQRAGKALGADFIVTGSFREEIKSGATVGEADGSKLSIEVCVKDVVSGKIVKEIRVNGKTEEFFKLEKEIILGLIEILDMGLSEDAKKQIDGIITQSLEAVLHFGRGEKFAIMSGRHRGWRGMVCGEISEEESEKLLLRAISEFRQALYLDPEYADAQYAISITFANLAGVASAGHKKMSLEEIAESEKFISQFPNDARCVERITRLGSLCFDRGYASHSDIKNQTEYYDKSIQWYKKRIFEYGHIEKGIVEAIRQLAYMFERKKDYISAVETFEYLIKHYPEEKGANLCPAKIQARHHIFNCYRKMKKHDKALETLNYITTNQLFTKPYLDKSYPKKMLGEHRDDILIVRKLRGDIYLEIEDYEKAVNEWLEISKEVGELSDNEIGYIRGFDGFTVFRFWVDLAEAYRKLNKRGQVIYFLEKAVSHCSRWDDGNKLRDVYFELGQFYEEEGNYAKALSIYEAKLERLGPDLRLEKRIPVCWEKLGIAQKGKLLKWALFSPIRKRNKRFISEPSIKDIGYRPTCITTWGGSVWIAFLASSSKMDSGGNFEFKITGKYPPWYLYCLNLDSMTEKIIEVPDVFKIGWDEISDIAVDDKEVWLSCVGKGILCYDRLLKKWTHFTTDNGLVFNTTRCLALSQERIWFGFGEKGRGAIMAYDRKEKKWLLYYHPIATATAVTSLALDGNILWIGNERGVISILNTKDFSWKIVHHGKKGYSRPIKDISIYNDKVWFACSYNGIRRYDKKTSKWKTWKWSDPDLDTSLTLKCINVNNADVWTGGNGGVYKLDALSNQFAKIDAGRFFRLNGTASIAVCDNLVWFVGCWQNIVVHIKRGIRESALRVNKD